MISVVVPVLNGMPYIREALESIVTQPVGVELIVCDGGSTDGTLDVVRQFEPDVLITGPDRGQAHAINRGMALASGPVLAWLNADDRYLPGALETVWRAFRGDPDLHWLTGSLQHIDAAGQVLRVMPHDRPNALAAERIFRSGARFMHNPYQAATFWTRRFWQVAGPLKERYHFCMDRRLWYAGLAHGFIARAVPDALAAFRLHADSKTTTHKPHFELERALIHIEIAGRAGFTLWPNLRIAHRFFRQAALGLADWHLARGSRIRAAGWLLAGLVAQPAAVRRRLWTWRQILLG